MFFVQVPVIGKGQEIILIGSGFSVACHCNEYVACIHHLIEVYRWLSAVLQGASLVCAVPNMMSSLGGMQHGLHLSGTAEGTDT